jgi:hypothetical protein
VDVLSLEQRDGTDDASPGQSENGGDGEGALAKAKVAGKNRL